MSLFEVVFPADTTQWDYKLDEPVSLELMSAVLCVSYTSLLWKKSSEEVEIHRHDGSIKQVTETNKAKNPPEKTLLNSAPKDLYTIVCAVEEELARKTTAESYKKNCSVTDYNATLDVLAKAKGNLKPAVDPTIREISFVPKTLDLGMKITQGDFESNNTVYRARLGPLSIVDGDKTEIVQRKINFKLENGVIEASITYSHRGDHVYTAVFPNLNNHGIAITDIIKKYAEKVEIKLIRMVI